MRGRLHVPRARLLPRPDGSAADDEAAALAAAVASFRDAGLEPDVVSGGSTPTLAHTHTDALTELRPGVYVFGDAQQWELGAMAPELDRAHLPGHGRQPRRRAPGPRQREQGARRRPGAVRHRRRAGSSTTRTRGSSSSPSTTRSSTSAAPPLPPLGSQVDVVPNHVCAAVNLADTLWADDGTALVSWPVAARGRNG